MLQRSWLLLLVALAAGCFLSPAWREKRELRREGIYVDDPKHLAEVEERARFELACPTAHVAVVFERYKVVPTVVGVAGCGKRATYSRRLRRHHGMMSTRNAVWERGPIEFDVPTGAVILQPVPQQQPARSAPVTYGAESQQPALTAPAATQQPSETEQPAAVQR